MPLYRLTELLEFLESIGEQPKKGLSQNFLIDGNIVKKIITCADIASDDRVLEIGSGPGVLTEALLETGATLVAVEKDEVFADRLKRLGRLDVFTGDIRDFPFDTLKSKMKVVSNLPYHLTTPILTLLTPLHEHFESLTVMIQDEVAKKIVSKEESSILLIFLNFYSDATYAFPVSKNCFYPKPKVDSAVIKLVLKKPPRVNEKQFFSFVRKAFEQKRKMITNSLSRDFDSHNVHEALAKCGLKSNARPEELSLEAFLTLYHELGGR